MAVPIGRVRPAFEPHVQKLLSRPLQNRYCHELRENIVDSQGYHVFPRGVLTGRRVTYDKRDHRGGVERVWIVLTQFNSRALTSRRWGLTGLGLPDRRC